MVDDGAHAAHRASVDQQRITGGRPLAGTVEVQQSQHPGWAAEIMDPRHGFLAAVTALVQVNRAQAGGADPADLVRDRPFVGVHSESRSSCGHPVRLIGPNARPSHPGCGESVQPRLDVGPRNHQIELNLAGGGPHPAHKPAAGQSDCDRHVGKRVQTQRRERLGFGQFRPDQRQHRQIRRGRLRVRPENHLLQIAQQRFAAPRFGIQIGDPARIRTQFGLLPVVLHPSLAVEAQVLGAGAVSECGQVLGRNRMKPGPALGTGKGEDRAMGPVHHHRVVFGGPLLGERIAVVPDRAEIGRVGGHRHG